VLIIGVINIFVINLIGIFQSTWK